MIAQVIAGLIVLSPVFFADHLTFGEFALTVTMTIIVTLAMPDDYTAL